jgi:oligopeptidase B
LKAAGRRIADGRGDQSAPEIFRAVLSHVPFVDVMNTMLDASLPLTVPEYEEWGNPNEAEYFTTC